MFVAVLTFMLASGSSARAETGDHEIGRQRTANKALIQQLMRGQFGGEDARAAVSNRLRAGVDRLRWLESRSGESAPSNFAFDEGERPRPTDVFSRGEPVRTQGGILGTYVRAREGKHLVRGGDGVIYETTRPTSLVGSSLERPNGARGQIVGFNPESETIRIKEPGALQPREISRSVFANPGNRLGVTSVGAGNSAATRSGATTASARTFGQGVARASGAIQGAEVVIKAADQAARDRLRAAIDAGTCPAESLSRGRAFAEEVAGLSWGDRTKIFAACESEGRPVGSGSLTSSAKNHPRVGWSQVRCQSDGTLVVIHQNMVTSEIVFQDGDRLREIRSHHSLINPGDDGSVVKMVVEPGSDRFVVNDPQGRAALNYPWRKGLVALYCAAQVGRDCGVERNVFVRGVADVNLDRPARAGFNSNVVNVANTMYQLRAAVALQRDARPTFRSTCEALGGKMPGGAVTFRKFIREDDHREDSAVPFKTPEGSRSSA